MILEAGNEGSVREVLVIAAGLSIQDPRERPLEHREAADAAHRRFDVGGSDLVSMVRLWDHLREQQRQLSGNAFRRLCRTEYLNYLRVREWQDLFSQLRQVAGDLGLRAGRDEARRTPSTGPCSAACCPTSACGTGTTGSSAGPAGRRS